MAELHMAAARKSRKEHFGEELCIHSVIYPADYCTSGCTYCNLSTLLDRSREVRQRGQMSHETFDLVMQQLVELGYHVHELVFGTLSENQDRLATTIAKWVERARVIDPEGYFIVNCDTLQPAGYRRLRNAGTDAVWTFIETMDPEVYSKKHRRGIKADRQQRLEGPQRMRDADLDVGNALLWGLVPDWESELEKFVTWSREVGGFDFVATTVLQRFTLAPGVRAPAQFDLKPPLPITSERYLDICARLRLAMPDSHIVGNTRIDPAVVYGEASRYTDMCNGYVWAGARSHPDKKLATPGEVHSGGTQMHFFNPGADPAAIQRLCPSDIAVRLRIVDRKCQSRI